MEFGRELKRLAGKCEFTNVQLSDIPRDCFISNSTFQEAVHVAIAQEITQEDVRHFGGNPYGESSSSGEIRLSVTTCGHAVAQ